MNYGLGMISLLVEDYDKAIKYYTSILGFELEQDTIMSEVKRWVVLKTGGCKLLLAKAANEMQKTRVGDQTGGRVFLFLYTKDILDFENKLLANQVEIVRPLATESYGRVLVFKDLYGNLWDLIEPNKKE